ncbi:hypothetical protein PG990_002284 [Apiospora arundinis]|uniref:Apple domain-containing protein n=1 Tax=Apiospora arundinis TaxID=335852 RepID=A0ABR2I544_9PEZI
MWSTGILFIFSLAISMAGAKQNDLCVNGTIIGSIQRFEVHCSSTAKGKRTASVDVATLDDCADACARANPRCTAATFDGKSCAFHNETSSPLIAPDSNFKFTAVVGLPNTATSNCRAVTQATTMQTINDVQFTLSCGSNLNSESLSNHFAASLQDCMGKCAETSMCKAVSFNADQTLGFQNCFLKSKSSKSALSVASELDTAMVVRPKASEKERDKDTDAEPADNTNTNVMIIVAVSVSGFLFLASLGLLCWWTHRRHQHQRRLRSLPEGVRPVSKWDRDRMDEKYGVRTSVSSENFRNTLMSGRVENLDKPTPVYEIRRKGDSFN